MSTARAIAFTDLTERIVSGVPAQIAIHRVHYQYEKLFAIERTWRRHGEDEDSA